MDSHARSIQARAACQRVSDGETAESEGPIVQGRRLENSNNPNAWTAVAYGKGTWIIHMLRRRMGDAQFMKMLAELRRRYEWKTIDTEQFQLLCAEFLPPQSPDPKLENFFDQWVYGTGIPALKLNYSVKGKPGAWKLTGTVDSVRRARRFQRDGAGRDSDRPRQGGPAASNWFRTGAVSRFRSAANAKAVLDPAQACCDVRIVVSHAIGSGLYQPRVPCALRHHRSPL